MLDAANYSTVETPRDGRRVEIRAFKPDDARHLSAAAADVSGRSLYRRFFTVKRSFSDREKEFFLHVDFVDHVALLAWLEEDGREALAGGGRYVVVEPGKAEVAFLILDRYQGHGIGPLLLHHLTIIARSAGLQAFVAEVLPENIPMLKVFENSRLPMTTTRSAEVVHVTLQLV